MPEQDPIARGHNFQEVALGYTAEMAVNEANRCLNCKNMPCVSGCPVGVKIPSFIDCIKKGEFAKAYSVIRETNSLPAICGRVCPQENAVRRALRAAASKASRVAIGRLERFAGGTTRRMGVASRAPRHSGKWQARGRDRLRPRRALPARATLRAKGLRGGRCSRRCTRPAACWCTAFRNSACPRRWW